MEYPEQNTKVKGYQAFDPADYPDYEFPVTGPVRITPVPRGSWAGRKDFAVAPFKRGRDSRLCVNLTRKDGARRVISVDTIEIALGRAANVEGPLEPEDHWNPPDNPWERKSVTGFSDYVMDALGRVYRWRSPGRGEYVKGRMIVPSGHSPKIIDQKRKHPARYEYYRLQDDEGVYRNLQFPKLLELAGFTVADWGNALEAQRMAERGARGLES